MIKYISCVLRLGYINFILLRYNLYGVLFPGYLGTFISYCNPWYWLSLRKITRGERIRLAITDLGPIFVKIGQILSTRIDIIPPDISSELAKLQDKVQPFSGKLARAIIAKHSKLPVEEIFTSLDEHALASASIAQVHSAILLDGKKVVVKVLRPKVRRHIARDLALLSVLAQIAQNFLTGMRGFKPKEIVQEIAYTLYAELDLMLEGANAAQLRRNFANSPYLYIPEIYWSFSSTQVLVMEEITGIPINDVERLKLSGFNLSQIAERSMDIFFTQVFRDNFFHADLHPGNIFIGDNTQEQPQYLMVDFGIVGSLSSHDQHYLAANILALLKRDYRRVAELHISSGWLPLNSRVDLFEAAIRAVCEPVFNLPLEKISFAHLLFRLFKTARSFHINIQPQLILLQKSLLSIESLSRSLDPKIEIINTATPYIERWLSKQFGVSVYLKRLCNSLPILLDRLPGLPQALTEVLRVSQQLTKAQHNERKTLFGKSFGIGMGLGLITSSGVIMYLSNIIPFFYVITILCTAGITLLFSCR